MARDNHGLSLLAASQRSATYIILMVEYYTDVSNFEQGTTGVQFRFLILLFASSEKW